VRKNGKQLIRRELFILVSSLSDRFSRSQKIHKFFAELSVFRLEALTLLFRKIRIKYEFFVDSLIRITESQVSEIGEDCLSLGQIVLKFGWLLGYFPDRVKSTTVSEINCLDCNCWIPEVFMLHQIYVSQVESALGELVETDQHKEKVEPILK
jgi:hypothetical protein